MNLAVERESLVHKLSQQKKLFDTANTNIDTTLGLFKELSRECEELGLDGFKEMDRLTRLELQQKQLVNQELQVLDYLSKKISSAQVDLESIDLLQLYNEKMQQQTTLEELSNEQYIEFLKHSWEGKHLNEPFNPRRAYQILLNEQVDQSEEEEEDVAIVFAEMTFTCPITLQIMDEVWTCKKCKHCFSSAIRNLLQRNQGRIECPVTGCSEYVSMSQLYKDKALNRQLQKKKLEFVNETDNYQQI